MEVPNYLTTKKKKIFVYYSSNLIFLLVFILKTVTLEINHLNIFIEKL